ncbi:unnamed protein product [Vicia faba]|uniref:Uncharacterized protein n=1 Tax=Vicia faba TaxID=3906 RepID=A0AAV0YTT5_VICFA|nr:unnamed protein product [Vicia faba]
MTVQLIMEYFSNHTLSNKYQENDAVEEAASVETIADFAVSKFKNVISLLSRNRTRSGHARFRRAPLPSETIVYRATPLQQIPPLVPTNEVVEKNKIIDSLMHLLIRSCLLSPVMLYMFFFMGKPCVSSCSLKRKCDSENFGSGKCGSSLETVIVQKREK